MMGPDEQNISDEPVLVHGVCGRRVATCICSDGPGQSLAARVTALEAQVADLAAALAALDSAGGS